MTYALDTNVIIDLLNKKECVVKCFNDVIESKTPVVILSVVDYEVSRGFYHTPSFRKEAVYNNMRENCGEADTNAKVWRTAAKIWANLRKNGYTVADADILIAATCITNEYTLVTHNSKDFANIDGLTLEDWTA